MSVSLPLSIRVRLSVMMFFQFFIWGIWYVPMSSYLSTLGFEGADVGDAYSTVNWGAILAPFFVGMIADRFFPAEKVLGVLHILGGLLLYAAAQATTPVGVFWTLLAYASAYMPTLALVNTIAFHQMTDPGKQFPSVRVLGTIGWIVAGLLVDALEAGASATPFLLGAGVSIGMGLYSFALPSTPPKSRGVKVTVAHVLNLDALKLMKDRSFAVLVTASLLVSIPLAFYYAFTHQFLTGVGIEKPTAKMGLFGQGSEIGFMLLLPAFLARLGIKKTMLLGMLAWTTRYVLFAMGASGPVAGLLILGIALHGVCYDFFFVTGQIYVDRKAPRPLQASAQGLITLVTYGIGMLIGSIASGRVVDAYAGDWSRIWYVPGAMAAVIAVGFALAFGEPTSQDKSGQGDAAAA